MRKLNLIIFSAVLALTLLSGCGMPGPLYQTSDEKPASSEQSAADTNAKEQESN